MAKHDTKWKVVLYSVNYSVITWNIRSLFFLISNYRDRMVHIASLLLFFCTSCGALVGKIYLMYVGYLPPFFYVCCSRSKIIGEGKY